MEDVHATTRVRTIRPSRHVLLAVLGLGTIGVGFAVPASATTPNDNGAHKSYVCKYVGKPGDSELLQTGQNPIWVDNAAIMASSGKDSVTVGDTFVDGQYGSMVIVANSPKLDPEPGTDQCPGGTTPTETTSTTSTGTTTTPTETTSTTSSGTSTTSSGTSTTSSGTSTTSSGTSTTSTGTSTTSTGTSTTSTGTTSTTGAGGQTGGGVAGGGATGGGAAGAGVTGSGVTGADAVNAVPLAATDGADLSSGSGFAPGPRNVLFGSGALMLGGGLLGLRRKAQV